MRLARRKRPEMPTLNSAHPGAALAFFIAAIVLTVISQNPIWTAISLLCAMAFNLCIRKREALKGMRWILPLFCALTLLNPLFNTQGQTILFTYLSGRPYTLEALAYGAQTAGMLSATLLWFSSFNEVMTTDKLTYLFGSAAPALALVLTTVMRLVPEYARKAARISEAREGVGLSHRTGTLRERAAHGASTLSALTSWALEGSIVKADSMRSRGYGCGKRTRAFSPPFGAGDIALVATICALAAIAIAAAASGEAAAQFVPSISIIRPDALGVAGMAALATLGALPSALALWEEVSWRRSISRV